MEYLDDDFQTILISILCGCILGMEREYQNKSAGLRTIVLICLGSTIFTMISRGINGASDDRIAANIITGIGFIGAGVIFKENFNVKGLTTAAVIWISAAIGMLIGTTNYQLGLILSIAVLIILSLFSKIESLMDYISHIRIYRLTFVNDDLGNVDEVLNHVKGEKLRSSVLRLSKMNNKLILHIQVKGNAKHFRALSERLISLPEILEMEH